MTGRTATFVKLCIKTMLSGKSWFGPIIICWNSPDWMTEWNEDLMRINAHRGNGGNKLLQIQASLWNGNLCWSALAKFRCGVAPIRLETGRYEGLNVEDRLCPYCENDVKCESHVLLDCVLYKDLRYFMFEGARRFHINFYWALLLKDEKLSTTLSDTNLTIHFCQFLLWDFK